MVRKASTTVTTTAWHRVSEQSKRRQMPSWPNAQLMRLWCPPCRKCSCGNSNSTREDSALELAKQVCFGEKGSGMASRKKSYASLTKENLRELKKLAEQLEDFKLFKSLCDKDLTESQTIEALWDTYKEIAEGDKTEVSTDKRANLTSRYRENRKRWKQLAQWEKKDTNSKYADFYKEERQMLEWYLTESLKDIYTELAS